MRVNGQARYYASVDNSLHWVSQKRGASRDHVVVHLKENAFQRAAKAAPAFISATPSRVELGKHEGIQKGSFS